MAPAPDRARDVRCDGVLSFAAASPSIGLRSQGNRRMMIVRAMAALLAGAFLMAAAPTGDPYTYMEEAEGAKALEFAKAENARSLPQLQNDPRYAGLYADALKIATAKDRIPAVGIVGDGTLRDFWQDAEHVRGIWRTTSLASCRTAAPEWKTLLDIDALAKAEGANWVFKGAQCLKPANRYCLISLSNGGKDAVEVREFDTQTASFVDGGFHLPEGKHRVEWIDHDTLVVATDWTKGEATTSGYPYVAKILKRGQSSGRSTPSTPNTTWSPTRARSGSTCRRSRRSRPMSTARWW